MESRVHLLLLTQPQPYLQYLLGTEFGQLGVHFRKNILVYNYMFTYTSMGSRVDRSINRTKCPYVIGIIGQNYHHIVSL